MPFSGEECYCGGKLDQGDYGGDWRRYPPKLAIKGVNREIRTTQLQLRDVNTLLKLDSDNTELLAQKHRLIADAVLETLKAVAEQVNVTLAKWEITRE